MYNEHFGFSEAPFNVTPDSRFFFLNSCYEEAFATVSYGIDARKGFIVVTGEAGTGKTTVLKRLINSVDSHVHCVCVFDPHITINQLLRGMLGDLGLTPAGKDRLPMMAQLYDYLIEQLEKGDVVALLVDEAQSVSIAMLEELRLLSNLETDTEKLIQIILVGQPELVQKLDCPELVQLKQRVALRCRIRPLEAPEVGSYIDSRLKTIHYPGRDLFDGACVERIALYSKGIPRLINVICDNALLIACAAGRRWVSPDDIIEAATELHLVEQEEIRVAAKTPFAAPQQPAAAAKPPPSVWDTGAKPGEPPPPVWEKTPRPRDLAPQFEPLVLDMGAVSRRSRRRSFSGVLVWFLMAGTLLFFAVQQKSLALPRLRAYLENWTGVGAEDTHPAQALTPDPGDIAPAPMPELEKPAPLTETLNEDDDADVVSKRAEASPPAPVEKSVEAPAKPSSEVAVNKRIMIKPRTPVHASREPAVSDERLEIEIYKAIHDRAIYGVQVSWVNDGTVSLEGRVASRRQKLAAVRATLSVPGVKGVRDRIVID